MSERGSCGVSLNPPPLGSIKFYLKVRLFCYSSPSDLFCDQFSFETVLNLRVHCCRGEGAELRFFSRQFSSKREKNCLIPPATLGNQVYTESVHWSKIHIENSIAIQ
jgi:hypothetical protein